MLSIKDVKEGLIDANCQSVVIDQCMNAFQQGYKQQSIKLLTQERQQRLEAIHQQQKQLDCLDYLIYEMRHQ